MNKVKEAVIYGASGLGREIYELVGRDFSEQFKVVAFIDDSDDAPKEIKGIPVVDKAFLNDRELAVIVGFASTKAKKKLFEELSAKSNLSFPNIVSKHALVNDDVQLGKGVVITDFCWISTNVEIDDATFLNVGTLVGHDATIGKYCSFMSQCDICGNTKIDECVYCGAKTFFLQGIKVGNNAETAAGAIVIKNVKKNEIVSGNFAIPHIKHLAADVKDMLNR